MLPRVLRFVSRISYVRHYALSGNEITRGAPRSADICVMRLRSAHILTPVSPISLNAVASMIRSEFTFARDAEMHGGRGLLELT